MNTLAFEQIEKLLYSGEKTLESDKLFKKCDKLASKAEPNLSFGENDKRWLYFYFPVKLEKELPPAEDFALIPLALIWQKDGRGERYYLGLKSHVVEIKKDGQKAEKIYEAILEEAEKILPELDQDLLERHVPYMFREGRIKRKYIQKPEIPQKEAEKIMRSYEKRSKKEVYPISLKDYLGVAGYCLHAIFPEESKLSDRELYEKHSDFRRAGMLELKENNPKAFEYWYESDVWHGSHPFEIITSLREHGIILLPPHRSERHYRLSVGNEFYYKDYLKAVKTLVDKRVSFEAPQLGEVLEYLTGEAYLPVNKGLFSVECNGSEPFIKYVEWEPLKLPKLKF